MKYKQGEGYWDNYVHTSQFIAHLEVYGKSINELNDNIQHYIENNNFMEQYDKSKKWKEFKNPKFEITHRYEANPWWNGKKWCQRFDVTIRG